MKKLILIFSLIVAALMPPAGICRAQQNIPQSTSARALVFFMADSSDHVTGKTGLSPTVTLSKNGAAFGAASGAVTEISSGWYKLAGNTTDSNTLGALALHATGTGADPTDKVFVVVLPDDQIASVPNVAAGTQGGLMILGANTGTHSFSGNATFSSALSVGSLSAGSIAVTNGATFANGATNGNGLTLSGNGTGAGLSASGGATGSGINITSPATYGIDISAGGNNGMRIQNGMLISNTTGDALTISSTISGNGINISAAGASKHGIVSTGGSSGTSDGIKAVAGTGGAGLRSDSVVVTNGIGAASLAITNGATVGTFASGTFTFGTIALTNASNLSLLTIGTVSNATVGTNNDKTGYSLSVAPPTAAQVSTAVWAETIRSLTDKSGFALTQSFPANFSSMAITAGGAVTVGTNSDKTGYSLAVTPPTAQEVSTAVWSETTRSLTDKAGFSLATAPPTAAAISTAVWAEATRSLTDKAGFSLATAPPTASAIKDAVWNEAQAGHTTAGTFGKYLDAQVSTVSGGGGSVVGSGGDQITITWTNSTTSLPVADGAVWISTDSAGENIVAGTLRTDELGKAHFLLDAGNTYYLWGRKSGVNPISGQSFVAAAD